MKDLGLSVERTRQADLLVSDIYSGNGLDQVTLSASSERQDSIPYQRSSKVQYAWSMPELQVVIPLHPLIAESRRHAIRVQTAGYASSVSATTSWAVILGEADVAELKCTEADRVALRAYMDYLKG